MKNIKKRKILIIVIVLVMVSLCFILFLQYSISKSILGETKVKYIADINKVQEVQLVQQDFTAEKCCLKEINFDYFGFCAVPENIIKRKIKVICWTVIFCFLLKFVCVMARIIVGTRMALYIGNTRLVLCIIIISVWKKGK